MSKAILLIGGTGFLGSALRHVFAQDPDFSVSFSSTAGDAAGPSHLAMDLLDPSTLGSVRDFDVIVNLTGQVTEPMERCFALNSTGVCNLIQALRGGDQKVVHISTTQVYGTAERADETSPIHPESPYAASKAEAEGLLLKNIPSASLLIVRLCNLYGPGQNKGLPWYLLHCIRNNEEITISDNDGSLSRHFLHVEDAAQFVKELVACSMTGIVNVSGPEQHSIRALVALCEKVLGRSLSASYGHSAPKGNINSLSTQKLQAILTPQFRHTLEQYFREQFS